jgi:hypothetical protein
MFWPLLDPPESLQSWDQDDDHGDNPPPIVG